ncbi:MAG: acetate/propionate family kinase, partial [bacterium]
MRHIRHILCLNSGSSSLKFALYRVAREDDFLLAKGAVERIGLADGRLWFQLAHRSAQSEETWDFPDHARAVEAIFARLAGLHLPVPDAVGHRVVHGGPDYSSPAEVDERLMQTLRNLVSFAPLHLPSEIICIDEVSARFPALPQVACFDTAFHRRMPELAQRFPMPRSLWGEGIRRYGFHGLSYEYIMDALGARPPARLLIAHLGNGSSMAAVRDGIPLDTSMGFTPSGGFMMGTRTGDLDPGIVLHLMREKRMNADQL